jgi:hypothetical protein
MGLIYEHWRLDTNECFYIGQAMGKNPYGRAQSLSTRNPYYGHIVRKLKPRGLIETRISEFPEITQEAIDNLEVLAIAHWKMYVGDRLTNVAKGGKGGNPNQYKTAEELDEIHRKIKATKAAAPPEKKAEARAKRKATIDAKGPEEKAIIEAKRLATLNAKSPEQREIEKANRKAVRDARTPDQITLINKKISESLRKAHANTPPEKEAERIAKQKETKASRPPTDKQLKDRADRKSPARREQLRNKLIAAAARRSQAEWDDITSRANATKAARGPTEKELARREKTKIDWSGDGNPMNDPIHKATHETNLLRGDEHPARKDSSIGRKISSSRRIWLADPDNWNSVPRGENHVFYGKPAHNKGKAQPQTAGANNPMANDKIRKKQKENVPRGDAHYTRRPGYVHHSKKQTKNSVEKLDPTALEATKDTEK